MGNGSLVGKNASNGKDNMETAYVSDLSIQFDSSDDGEFTAKAVENVMMATKNTSRAHEFENG